MNKVTLTVNGVLHELTVEARSTLAYTLRETLGLTGTHVNCEQGVCGVCTVIVDNEAVRSCTVFTTQLSNSVVETVEGIGSPDSLAVLQQCFVEHSALQCGFCTPGFVTLCTAFLREKPKPTREEVVDVVSSNICRCTGYQGIIAAVEDAAERLSADHGEGPPYADGSLS